MISQLKVYAIGAVGVVIAVLAFLVQNEKLKARTKDLKTAKKTAQINNDVAKILANRNVREVLDGVDKEITSGDTSSLDR